MPDVRRAAVFGAGFIGKSLIRELLSLDWEVSVLDHNPRPETIAGTTRWLTGEFSDSTKVRRTLENVQVAFHLVSSTVPCDETAASDGGLSPDVRATLNFLEVCREVGVARVVFTSSASVYGPQHVTPIGEDAAPNPISAHGAQKLLLEQHLLCHRAQHGLDVRIVRLSNPYGPEQKIFGRQGFIALALGRWLNHQPILLRDGGRPIRDFVYIGDVARALARVGVRGTVPSVLNIGLGIGHSLTAVVDELGCLLGTRLDIEYGDSRREDIPTSVLDVSLARRALDFEPQYSLRDGLTDTLRRLGIVPQIAELR